MGETRIEEGIEWYVSGHDDGLGEDECQCARCGSSVRWVDCWQCDEEGYSYHDCGEDCCACLDPEPNVICDVCLGTCGWWRCCSTRKYCEGNPMPGREQIPSTACDHDED